MKRLQNQDTGKQFRYLSLLNVGCMILLVLLTCWTYASVILRRNAQTVSRIAAQALSDFSQASREITQLLETIAYNPTVVATLSKGSAYRRYLDSQRMQAFFSSITAIRPDVREILLLHENEEHVVYKSIDRSQQEIVRRLRNAAVPTVLGVYPYNNTGRALVGGCGIYDVSQNVAMQARLGYIVVLFDLRGFARRTANLTAMEGVYCQMTDARGEVLTGELPALHGAGARFIAQRLPGGWHNALWQVDVYHVPEVGGLLTVCIDKRVMLGDLWRATGVIFVLALLLLTAIQVGYHIVRSGIAQPITALTAFIHNMHTPDAPHHAPVLGNRDLCELSSTINRMADEQETLTQGLVEARTRLYEQALTHKRLELQCLRSQINPHFLYNTLEVIRAIAVVRGAPEVGGIAKSLAHILRYSIKGNDFVALAEELHVIADYMAIQDVRFRGRITYAQDVDEAACNGRVPRMCLQPLAENAVVHGLEIETFNRQLAQRTSPPHDESRGIGLLNVALRFAAVYGDAYEMKLSSRPGEGTQVFLSLPYTQEGEDG
ncbi:MAG: histidine kinase [Clostridia bacterium]